MQNQSDYGNPGVSCSVPIVIQFGRWHLSKGFYSMPLDRFMRFYFVPSNKFPTFATKQRKWTKNFFASSYLKIRNI